MTTRPEGGRATVLVVDDDARMRRLLREMLRRADFAIIEGDDGTVLERLVGDRRPDLVLLDLLMPQMSGLEALKRLRAAGRDVGVIVLSGVDDEELKVKALQAGADDYIVKPFGARELVARAEAVLRRTRTQSPALAPARALQVADWTFIPERRLLLAGDSQIELTRTEYDLLLLLARFPGRVFSSAELLTRIWGPEMRDEVPTLRTNVYRLRRKIEPNPRQPRYLRTHAGVGYFLDPVAGD